MVRTRPVFAQTVTYTHVHVATNTCMHTAWYMRTNTCTSYNTQAHPHAVAMGPNKCTDTILALPCEKLSREAPQ